MLKSVSVGFTDNWCLETIKDRRIYIMPSHGNQNHSLREMDTLLQEMRHLNAGHARDGMPAGLQGWGIGDAIKKATGFNDKVWDAYDDSKKQIILQNTMSEIAAVCATWHKDSLDEVKNSISSSAVANHILGTYKVEAPALQYNLPTKK